MNIKKTLITGALTVSLGVGAVVVKDTAKDFTDCTGKEMQYTYGELHYCSDIEDFIEDYKRLYEENQTASRDVFSIRGVDFTSELR